MTDIVENEISNLTVLLQTTISLLEGNFNTKTKNSINCYETIRNLIKVKKKISRKELKRIAGFGESTISNHASALQDQGLIRKEPDPNDKRGAIYAWIGGYEDSELEELELDVLKSIKNNPHKSISELHDKKLIEDKGKFFEILKKLESRELITCKEENGAKFYLITDKAEGNLKV